MLDDAIREQVSAFLQDTQLMKSMLQQLNRELRQKLEELLLERKKDSEEKILNLVNFFYHGGQKQSHFFSTFFREWAEKNGLVGIETLSDVESSVTFFGRMQHGKIPFKDKQAYQNLKLLLFSPLHGLHGAYSHALQLYCVIEAFKNKIFRVEESSPSPPTAKDILKAIAEEDYWNATFENGDGMGKVFHVYDYLKVTKNTDILWAFINRRERKHQHGERLYTPICDCKSRYILLSQGEKVEDGVAAVSEAHRL